MPINDLSIYQDHAAEWWNPTDPHFRSLISVNRFRLELMNRWVGSQEGATVVDIGCGGGLISVPLDHAGARIIGIDISDRSLAVAKTRSSLQATYLAGDARSIPLADESADLVVLADVLDHVQDYHLVITEGARILRSGGRLFLTTLNRSWFSSLLTVFIAENLRLIPPGTHDPRMFIKPKELKTIARRESLFLQQLTGGFPKIAPTLRNWAIELRESRSTAVFYAMLLQKQQA